MKAKVVGITAVAILMAGVVTYATSNSSELPKGNETPVEAKAMEESVANDDIAYIKDKYGIEPTVEKLDGKEKRTVKIEDPEIIKELVAEGIIDESDIADDVSGVEIVDVIYTDLQ